MRTILLGLVFLNLGSGLFAQVQAPAGFVVQGKFQERILTKTNGDVRIQINAPHEDQSPRKEVTTLILYALPNGNSIEQTAGRKAKTGEDWRFEIQHIAAQTRFLRDVVTNESIVIAYLENDLKSWPAWRKKHGDSRIPSILESVQKLVGAPVKRIVLTGHSGGGSLTFGYLNALGEDPLPSAIRRIGFLDSNYAYDTAQHRDKLLRWLAGSDERSLLVFAYHDDVALLNGKPFVSAMGGTWGRSHQMRKDFEETIPIQESESGEIKAWSGLNGRVRFFFKENPEMKIYHTVQVERNGFIHLVLAGTPHENKGYMYFGERAYERYIEPPE